jgi:SAM-dependent methyltransferase
VGSQERTGTGIGCGFGETLGYHRARGCEAFGVEADENILRVAQQYGYDVHAGLFDPSLFEPESFDYVTLDQVIEDVNDPVDTLQGITHVLRPGGSLILSTPNVDGWGAHLFGSYWINWHVPYHQHFFSRSSLVIAAEKAELELVEVRSVTPSVWLYYQWVHLLTRPVRGVLSSFWSSTANKGLMDTFCIKGLRLLHYSLLNHLPFCRCIQCR